LAEYLCRDIRRESQGIYHIARELLPGGPFMARELPSQLQDSAPSSPRRLLLVGEAATYLRISARSLASRNWRLRLGFPVVRVGKRLLFDLDEINRWLDGGR
jgi:hypothetical protein